MEDSTFNKLIKQVDKVVKETMRPSGNGGSPSVDDTVFVRKDPDETPRPPDPNGIGFGAVIDDDRLFDEADPLRKRPDDALSCLYVPEQQVSDIPKDLVETLISRGVLNPEQKLSLERILKQAPGRRVTDVLKELGVDEACIQSIVAEINRIPFERIVARDENACDIAAMKRIGFSFCRENLVAPLRVEGNRMIIATTSPDDVFLVDEVKRRLGANSVKHVLATSEDLQELVEYVDEQTAEELDLEELLSDVDDDDVEVQEDEDDYKNIEKEAESSPVVRYVNHIIQTALKEGASDIHIEPADKTLRVRFRVDGVLFEMMTPPRKMHAALTSRIKIMANLDIAERRLPQDGRIRATVMGRNLELRVSTIPTPKGEKTVMRILDTRSINVTLDDLGFSDQTLQSWRGQIAEPHGILLVTGPTGSGKTTTLYSSIRQMDTRKLNISTVEDPVEYDLEGITQIQSHEKIGMTFATALKALLRQDPDVVMVGEIRDLETAQTAIQAALTGHLVLSTLHTNDAPSSITRLINIGIEPFLVGAGLNAVLAQRLVRRVCPECAKKKSAGEEVARYLEGTDITIDHVMHGAGCPRCRQTGYNGRLGIYELLEMDDHLRDTIARSPNVTEFRRSCCERGMRSLREDGFLKVRDGLTSVEEILRVTEAG
ncbi:MAG: hypothetical protein CMJ32_00215 [Phycisphaerae bacterium]|nr:hypothetical protein [Phycisphaerae bacterium]